MAPEHAYPPVPAPGVGEGTLPYEPAPSTPPHPAAAAEQEKPKEAGNVVYMTEAELKQVVVQPGSQVVMVTAAPQAQRGCVCTAGWVLFGVGFAFPICWLVGVFLWLCTKNRHDKHAAIGSGVAIAVYAVFLGLFLGLYVVPLTRMTFAMVNDLANNPNYWSNPNNWNTTGLGVTWNGTAFNFTGTP